MATSNTRSGAKSARTTARVGDDAVKAKTGRDWAQWFRLLDKAGARKLDHKTIARWVHEKHGILGWWAQTVTVAYEQERGMRAVHQKSDGFSASRSKTIAVGLSTLYGAWADGRRRNRWLGEKGLKVTTATRDKSLHILWSDGTTRVNVWFVSKGPAKSMVQLQHTKLGNTRDVQRMKAFWGERLDALKSSLESV